MINYRPSGIQHARTLGYYVAIDIWNAERNERIGEHSYYLLNGLDMETTGDGTLVSMPAMGTTLPIECLRLTPAKRMQLEALCKLLNEREELLAGAGFGEALLVMVANPDCPGERVYM